MAGPASSAFLEAAMLSLLFLSIAAAMVVFRVLAAQKDDLSIATGLFSACAGIWLIAVSPIRFLVSPWPIVWDIIAMTSLYFMPATLCLFACGSFACTARSILRRMRQLHVVFAMTAIIAVSANLTDVTATMSVFFAVSLLSAGILSYCLYQSFHDGAAKIFLLGASVALVFGFAGWQTASVRLILPFKWLTHWGLLFLACSMATVIRYRIMQANQEARAKALRLEQENKKLHSVCRAANVIKSQAASETQSLAVKLREQTNDLLTAQQKIEADQRTMEKTRDRLIETERLSQLGVLVAGLAHELNTPLGIGVTAASNLEKEVEEICNLLESGSMKKSDLERHLALSGESATMILSNLRGAAELIRSFKTVAADQNQDLKREFGLKAYLEQVLLSLKPRTAKAGHVIQVSCNEGIVLYGHPGAFAQIITNLVINSLTHAFGPEEKGIITIDAFKDFDHVALRYGDNGKGIAEETLPNIFDPFFTTRKGDDGTGLGLYIVKSIVSEQFGGTISCTSTPGVGTTFYVRFPLREERRQ